MIRYLSKFLLSFSISIIGVVTFTAPALAEIRLGDKIPYSSKLLKGKLSNGLTYYIQKNAKPEKKLELRLVVKTGSIMEDDDQQGLAHFTEHMAFNGSKHFKKNALVSFLESIGVKFGADLNAYTGFDETVYILPVPTDTPENVDKAFMVLADWAGGLRFDKAEIDKERGVVLEEARLGKGAQDRMNKVILPKMLYGSKYAQRLPIGKEEILKTFSYDALKRFYADWYRPNLMAVVVVGDIDNKQAQLLVKKYFGALRNPINQRERLTASLPLHNLAEAIVVTDKEAPYSSVSISQSRFLDKNDGTFKHYRGEMVENFFNTMLGYRLQELTQTANPPFLNGGSGVSNLVGHYSEFTSAAVIGKTGVSAAIDALLQENKRVAQFGFTENELERVKLNALRSMENTYKEKDKTDSIALAEEFIRNFLTSETIPGVENEYRYHKEFVQSISLKEVNQYAASMLNSKAPQLVVYKGTEAADVPHPDAAQLLAMVQSAQQKTVTATIEKTMSKKLFDTPPKAGTVISESVNSVLGTTDLVLSNGVKVTLKLTDFKNDQILITASRYGGAAQLPDADIYNAKYATSIVGSMGIKEWAPTDLRKVLAGKSASVATNFSENTEGLSGSSNKADVEIMLQLIHLVMTQPRKDEALFQSFIGKQQDALKNMMVQPEAVFDEQLIDATYPPHPRKPQLPKPEQLTKLDLDRMMAIYKERLSSAKEMNFFVVGSFDIATLKPLLATYLGSLPTTEMTIGIKDHGLRTNRGIIKKEVFAGKEQKSLVSLQFNGDATYSNDASMKFNALNEVMQLRLTETLREELGAVYSPQIFGHMYRVPYGNYRIMMNLPCAPGNVDKLITSTFSIIDKLKTIAPSELDLHKVKQNWLKNHKERMKSNDFWIYHLNSSAQNGEDPANIFTYEARVNALTSKDIVTAAKIYFDTENYIQVVMYPEKNNR